MHQKAQRKKKSALQSLVGVESRREFANHILHAEDSVER